MANGHRVTVHAPTRSINVAQYENVQVTATEESFDTDKMTAAAILDAIRLIRERQWTELEEQEAVVRRSFGLPPRLKPASAKPVDAQTRHELRQAVKALSDATGEPVEVLSPDNQAAAEALLRDLRAAHYDLTRKKAPSDNADRPSANAAPAGRSAPSPAAGVAPRQSEGSSAPTPGGRFR